MRTHSRKQKRTILDTTGGKISINEAERLYKELREQYAKKSMQREKEIIKQGIIGRGLDGHDPVFDQLSKELHQKIKELQARIEK